MKKRVLVITYYWPPSGGSGVQRWLKFVKYLPQLGWQPIIYTVENGEFPAKDQSLVKDIPADIEVIRTPIWEPYSFYKRFTKQKDKKTSIGFISDRTKPSLTEKISIWVRGNFFIPDARVFWIKPSVKYLTEYISKNKIDVLVTSGPPHSCHMIGLKLKEKLGIKWIADFRDPWTGVFYFSELMLTTPAVNIHKRMERNVLNSADRVIVVGDTMKKDFEVITNVPIDVITNGYDEEDYEGVNVPLTEEFTISNIGLLSKTQNNNSIWKAISELVAENKQFAAKLELRFVGHVDAVAKESLEQFKLSEYSQMINYVPHDKVVEYQKESQVLLLSVNRVKNSQHLLTGKLFEYMASGRPILCVGPVDGDAAAIVKETNTGATLDFDDVTGIKRTIKNYFDLYLSKNLNVSSTGVEKYSRRNLSKELAAILSKEN